MKSIVSINSNNDKTVSSVNLSDGSSIPCQLVIIAAGSRPFTQFLQEGTNLEIAKDGGLICDHYLETNIKDIFAAGDVSTYPNQRTGLF